ncbi:NAD(P)/FAD-dependent oxidoreductase [Actinoplanes sp. NPDC049668]|uniref:NAD(P)/FAD-dependent oxidoreductase n=1 Tax=unclassified Actinoplanes TaxID=2626549 RepID=UPI0033B4ECFC
MRTILVVGGGYAGFYTAWKLEKKLRRGEARVIVVDPRPYMTYQPFLPEVVAGSVEARHAAVSLRRHLRRTRLIAGRVSRIDHANRTVVVRPAVGEEYPLEYDIIVVTAGAVTRVLAVPGVAEHAIGMKHVEEAVAIRDRLLTAFDQAAGLPPGPQRRKLLTVTFVGGGFSGVEGFGELLTLARALVRRYPELSRDELSFHLVEASGRILPEVGDGPGEWVVRSLEKRGARVHLNSQLVSASDGRVVLSTGEEFDSELIVWTVGNAANPMVHNHTDLPINARGMLVVRADLRVGTDAAPVPDAWGAGDDAAVPDLAAGSGGTTTVPNAQHAVRQGKLLARNLIATLRGREPKPYLHHSLGVVATLGIGRGLFQFRRLVIKGFPAWLMHRGYHVLAVPTWERKVRVFAVWATAALFGRDIVSLTSVQHPREAFVTGAADPPRTPAMRSGESR